MYTTLSRLQSAIRSRLQKSQSCRIYNDSLFACWPNIPDHVRSEKIAQFAAQNHWSVTVRELAGFGLVAEFSPAGATSKPKSP